MPKGVIYQGHVVDALRMMKEGSVNCVVTSPPYWSLRDYKTDHVEWPEVRFQVMPGTPEMVVPPWKGELGQEEQIEEFIAHMVLVFRGIKRVLRDDGVVWLNIGDCYAASATARTDDPKYAGAASLHGVKVPRGLKPKDILGMPWRLAFALQADGWYLRCPVIWAKSNSLPSSVKDRPSLIHEYVFLISKSQRYWYDPEAIREKAVNFWRSTQFASKSDRFGVESGIKNFHVYGSKTYEYSDEVMDTRNARSVWFVSTATTKEAHFAVMSKTIASNCVRSGCPKGGTVLDPFLGSGTTGLVAELTGRNWVGIEVSGEYVKLARKLISRSNPFRKGSIEVVQSYSGTKPKRTRINSRVHARTRVRRHTS